MSTFTLSSHDVKRLSQILHTTSKSLGRTSQLASQREYLSKLLGFHDWNGACALLPEQIHDTTHVAIALLELPSVAPKLFMTTGIDAPFRLPEKLRDYLIKQLVNPTDLTVPNYSRPDPVGATKSQCRHYNVVQTSDCITEHKMVLAPQEPDYGHLDHTPIVMTFANTKGHKAFTVTVWSITLQPESRTATNFTGAVSLPFYNTFIESITGRSPELRQAFCLVSNRQDSFASAIVRCNERGSALELVEHLPYMEHEKARAKLASYNDSLGLSLLDVADITGACAYNDQEQTGHSW